MKMINNVERIKNFKEEKMFRVFLYKKRQYWYSIQCFWGRNKGKICEKMKPVFIVEEYQEYENTQVRKLTPEEVERYMSERKK